MIYGYARVSTDGQSVAAQVALLRRYGAGKVFREVASGARTDRAQLRRLLDQLDAGDVMLVTRLSRLARSTRDLLKTLAAIADRKAGFRSLGDAWADTTTEHGRLMLTVLGGLAEFERDLIRVRSGWGDTSRCHPSPTTGHTGLVPRRFDRVRLGQRHGVGGDRVSRRSGCAVLVEPPGVLTCARTPSANRRRPLQGTLIRHDGAVL